RSALTQRVNLIGAKKFNHFMILLRFQSGQLRNLGSNQCPGIWISFENTRQRGGWLWRLTISGTPV
ncbi:hypothetical protein, partial [Rhodoferax sp.]|uniref:hypothetical protein n=1 Tax=Rhodoferax sp. TaxID=50421 RepID=UPI00271B313A